MGQYNPVLFKGANFLVQIHILFPWEEEEETERHWLECPALIWTGEWGSNRADVTRDTLTLPLEKTLDQETLRLALHIS